MREKEETNTDESSTKADQTGEYKWWHRHLFPPGSFSSRTLSHSSIEVNGYRQQGSSVPYTEEILPLRSECTSQCSFLHWFQTSPPCFAFPSLIKAKG